MHAWTVFVVEAITHVYAVLVADVSLRQCHAANVRRSRPQRRPGFSGLKARFYPASRSTTESINFVQKRGSSLEKSILCYTPALSDTFDECRIWLSSMGLTTCHTLLKLGL